MKNAILKTIEQNDNVSLYSICFNGSDISEYENFLMKFKDNSTLNQDFQRILVALEKIIERDEILILGNGGVKTTRTYQEDEELSGYVMDLQSFDELLKQAQRNGSITIEKNLIVGIENKTFEL